MKIFIAGATGALGLPLARVLVAMGHDVTGMTRPGAGADRLRDIGARISHADAFDRNAVREAVAEARPDVIIDQLTRLPADPADIIESMPDDTRLHDVAGSNLLAAAGAAGADRYIMQSRGFYLDGVKGGLADETARLRVHAPGEIGKSATVLDAYEHRVLHLPGMQGVVLRYGFFYGPGTWYGPDGAVAKQARDGKAAIIGNGDAVWSFVHIDDAIAATVAALTGQTGVYNIVDDDPLPVSVWLPAFSRWVGAPAPASIDAGDASKELGEESVYYHTQLIGASNRAARRMLGFRPRPLLWKDA